MIEQDLTEKFHADHRVLCPQCQDAEAISQGHKDAVRDLRAERDALKAALVTIADMWPSENQTAAADFRVLQYIARQALANLDEGGK